PVPIKCKSAIAPPFAMFPRIRNGSFVFNATSNFQSRSGGAGNENSGREDGGCGGGRPGKPMGRRSMFFKNWLFVAATVPVTVAELNGPLIFTSASTRAVTVSL